MSRINVKYLASTTLQNQMLIFSCVPSRCEAIGRFRLCCITQSCLTEQIRERTYGFGNVPCGSEIDDFLFYSSLLLLRHARRWAAVLNSSLIYLRNLVLQSSLFFHYASICSTRVIFIITKLSRLPLVQSSLIFPSISHFHLQNKL